MTRPESLWEAWGRVQRGGRAPGMDGVTLAAFDRHAERELARLREELRGGTYRPWPTRRVGLPKADGSTRAIGIQAVRDRVAQRALLLQIQPRIEASLEDCSFAFRPRRSVEMALARLDGLRASGFSWVARADVTLCFDSLDRSLLEQRLQAIVPEEEVHRLVTLWLTAGAVDESGWAAPERGVPQGDVLSPLLCNLYLDPFDEAVCRPAHPLVRYADDFILAGRTERDVRRGLALAEQELTGLGLVLNARKQWVGTFSQGFEYLGAAVIGSLRLPLHRHERPGHPPQYTFQYGDPLPRQPSRLPAVPPLLTTERALRERMVELLRAERSGCLLSPMNLALLHAWQEAGALPQPPRPVEPESWQSVYLI